MHRSTRFALSLAIAVAAAFPSVAGAQAVPRPASGSASGGASSGGSTSSGSSSDPQSAGNPRTAGASEGQSRREPSSAGRVTGSAVSRGGTSTPSRPSGGSVSSGSSSTSSSGRRTGATADTRTSVGRASRDRNDRPIRGTAVERPRTDVTFINFPYFGPWGRWFPYYGSGYGWGYVAYDPWNYYGGTRWRWNRYGWYDPYDWYGGYGGYGGYDRRDRYDEYDEPEEAPRARMGSIRLRANPNTARVYIDGALVGTVDDFDGLSDHLELEAGTHQLELRLEGYETYQSQITVEADTTRTERVNLKKIK